MYSCTVSAHYCCVCTVLGCYATISLSCVKTASAARAGRGWRRRTRLSSWSLDGCWRVIVVGDAVRLLIKQLPSLVDFTAHKNADRIKVIHQFAGDRPLIAVIAALAVVAVIVCCIVAIIISFTLLEASTITFKAYKFPQPRPARDCSS